MPHEAAAQRTLDARIGWHGMAEAPAYAPLMTRSMLRYGSLGPSEKPPPYSRGQVATQIAIGSLTGFVGALGGGFIGAALEDCSDGDFLCGLGGAVLGGSIGLVIGSAAGVYAVGRTGETYIRFLPTLGGSVVGLFGFGLVLAGVSAILPLNGATDVLSILIFVAPAAGATFIGNLSRQYREGREPGGVLNLRSGAWQIGMPAIGLSRVPHLSPQVSVSLFRLTW